MEGNQRWNAGITMRSSVVLAVWCDLRLISRCTGVVLKFRGHKTRGRDRGTGLEPGSLCILDRLSPLSHTVVLQPPINAVGLPQPRSSDLVQQVVACYV